MDGLIHFASLCYDTAMINIKLFHFKFKNARIKQIEHSAGECIIPIR